MQYAPEIIIKLTMAYGLFVILSPESKLTYWTQKTSREDNERTSTK